MNVIVGIDGTEQQPDALALGAQLSRVEGGRLVLAHVYPWDQTLRPDAEALLRGASRLTGVPSTIRAVADPSVPHGLHRVARDEEADVLVVGSSHRGPVGRALLGGVGDRVVHGAPCAVAVAPRGYADATPDTRRVGVAYDGSPEARRALAWAGGFAEAVGATVAVLSVVELPTVVGFAGVPYDVRGVEQPLREACRRELDEAVASLPDAVRATGELLDGPPAHALATAAAGVDLMVTGSRAHGAAHSTLLGSVSRALIHHAPCPLVVVPRPRARHLARSRRSEAGAPA
ncbi:MAG TPA: universal stress protein [Solirubrobacteraceae bacterium]|jgi:nucleotide-binding universal stress UspA family protein